MPTKTGIDVWKVKTSEMWVERRQKRKVTTPEKPHFIRFSLLVSISKLELTKLHPLQLSKA